MGPSKNTPKTKTFTGCWTCRSRKVKCDTTRPICTRCVKAGLTCQGYDVRLHWVDDDDPVAPSAIKRQAMGLILGNPHWPTSLANIDERLHELDRCQAELGSETILSGPFGLFGTQKIPSENHRGVLSETDGSSIWTRTGEPTEYPNLINQVDLARQAVESEVIDPSNYPCLVYSTGLHGEAQTLTERSKKENVEYVLRSPHYETEIETRSLIVHSHLGRTNCRDTLVNKLMNHYVHNVANILQPIRHPRNTYSSMYASSAMAVARKIPWGFLSNNSQVSNSKVALVYSLLASSAFQLRGHNDNPEVDILAKSFRNQAISHLQLALNSLSGPLPNDSPAGKMVAVAKREEVLSVMLTLITADILDGQMSEFWIHLNGAEQIARWLSTQVVSGSRGEHLLNVSLFHRIIAKSTDSNMESKPWTESLGADAMPHLFHGNGQGLEITYGITATLADFIRRITLLAQNVSYYQSRSFPFPPGLQSDCNRLLRDISSWDISQEKLRSLSNIDNITVLLASKHILAFANSVRIYFHTRVVPCTPLEMASYVSVVAAHLSDIESIKKRTGYNAVLTATIAWPGFIASCEAERTRREIWSEWWENMLEYRIGNIKSLWSVVKETWALKDQGDQHTPAWLSVLRQKDKRILVL